MKKTLSLVLAVLMIMATVPMAFAADPIALTQSNVTVWPTAEGSIYFGQILSDGITLSGGEVQYNGTIVPGYFEFKDTGFRPTASGKGMANLNFVPEDLTAYTGFNVPYAWKVMYTVNATKPQFVNEENDPVIASEIEPGAKLSTSILSGGKMYNPYYPEESKVQSKTWIWADELKETIINKSGYYDATFAPGAGYEVITESVYVKVKGDIPTTVIEEMPRIDITYEEGLTWGQVELIGGKAVIDDGTGTEVSGTFTVTDEWSTTQIHSNIKFINVTFTPDDETVALPNTFECPVNVAKKPIAFLDENGNAVTEGFVFEVEPNEKINNIKSYLYPYIQMPANSVYRIETDDTYAVNGKEYMLYVIHSDSNYVGSEIYFTVKFKETVVEPSMAMNIGVENGWKIDCGKYNLPGNFTVNVTLDGTKVATLTTSGSAQVFTFAPAKSGKYVYEISYNPVEGDYFVVEDFTVEKDTKLAWTATIDSMTAKHNCGDTVEARSIKTGVIGWKATDTNGNPVTLTLVSGTMESEIFTFIMPDHNVILTPEFEAADDNNGGILDGIGDIDGIDGILDWLRSLIEKIKGIFEKIIAFFQSIGDMT